MGLGHRQLASGRIEGHRVNARANIGRIVDSTFRPAFALGNAHAQTLTGGLLPARLHAPVTRERWELPDGDFADVDWAEPSSPAGWALILPGLVGDLSSPYATRLFNRLYRAGLRTGLLNYRGLSGFPNRVAKAYHAGFTQDLDLLSRRLRQRHGPGIVIGYSMGGNLLLKWLGEVKSDAPICAAAAVSAPFLLAAAADNLGIGPARYYGRYLTGQMIERIRRKFRVTPPASMPPLRAIRSLRDFDEYITAPLHGFANAEDYYQRNSCLDSLHRIEVPTLIVNAVDDPLVPRATLPGAEALSPQVTLELSRRGGHIGFVGRGRFGLPRFWIEDRLIDFFAGYASLSAPNTRHGG